ncbi:MAG: Tetratricopeptide 2 repeat protein [Marmoricola sp.]|nr:Tetratricopeptide 2 repeat protein [Marmoricola sp.]
MNQAEELHRQAVEAGNANNYAAALELIDRARTLTTDPDLIDRLDVTAAYGSAEVGRHAAAVALCERVLGRDGVSPLAAGLASSQLALLHMRNGEMDRASEQFAEAVQRLRGMPEHLGITYLNRGNLFLHQGDPLAAAADFIAAAQEFESAADGIQRAKAIHNLGYAHLLRGDLVAAMRHMQEVSETLGQQSTVTRAAIEQDRAEVLLAAGRSSESVVALENAAEAYGHEGLRRFQAECEFVLAKTLLIEDPGRARTYANTAARRFRDHGSQAWASRASAVGATAEIQAGSLSRALLRKCDELVAHLRASGYKADADRLGLHACRLCVRRGDLAEAAVRLAKIRSTQDSPVTTRLLAREIRAELAAAQGHPGRTRMYASRGLAELHGWQSTFGSLDLQTSAVGHGEHLARLGLRAAMADGSPAVVFEWSERARALASRVTALRPPPDPALAADLTALRVADPADLATRRVLRERIRSHSWFAAQGTVGEPADLKTLHRRLAVDDSALVAHIVLDDTLTALAVTATEAVVIPLGAAAPIRAIIDRVAADLDFAAQNRDGAMASAIRTSLRADLARVADVLVRPVLATVGYRRLVLTPSALLSGTPWTELPGLIGRAVTVPTSASQWLNQAERPIAAVREVGLLAGPRLTRATEEIQRAGESWPRAHVLSGRDADSARAGWLAARADLLHIAGHGSHVGDNPLFSAVELADGPWFGHDIDLLPRTPEVVVLSACELGRSSTSGEEAVGMSAVWLHAGARTVVSSLALIADDLACEVFASWHRLVSTGVAPADALAQVSAATDDVVPLLCFGAGW